jgi:hypothetical protein
VRVVGGLLAVLLLAIFIPSLVVPLGAMRPYSDPGS